MAERVICGPRAQAALLADLAARPHIEACGLLLGSIADDAWQIADAVPLRNSDDSAASFEFDPEELLLRDLEHGERIVGAYHSHLGGPAYPSRKDLRNMLAHTESPWIWLIVATSAARSHGSASAAGQGRAAAEPAAAPSGEAADARAADGTGAAATSTLGSADERAGGGAPAAQGGEAAGWSGVRIGAFRVDAAGTLLIYPVGAESDESGGTSAPES